VHESVVTMQREREDARPGALLSVAESAANARPLRFWRAEERERVARTVADALRGWLEAWGVDGDPDAVRCDAPIDSSCSGGDFVDWRHVGEGMGGLWWTLSPAVITLACGPSRPSSALALSALSRALFGETSACGPSLSSLGGAADHDAAALDMATEIVEAAWRDWLERLGEAFATAGAARGDAGPAPEPMLAWTGGLVVTVAWCGHALRLLIEGGGVAQFLRPASAPVDGKQGMGVEGGLTPVWRALADRPTRLRVQTHAFELDLGTLAGLRVGDVLRTGHALDDALPVNVESVNGEGGGVVCAGFLGKLDGSRAVELMHGLPPAGAPSDLAAAGLEGARGGHE
jgi:hypothetical protein